MKAKGIRTLLILFILMFNIIKAQKSYIYVAPTDVTTPYAINCNNLFNAFGDRIAKIKLNSKKSKEIYLLTRSLKKMDAQPYMDIRYKGEFYFKKQKFNFCGDQASIFINGVNYSTSKILFNYIKNLRNKNKTTDIW